MRELHIYDFDGTLFLSPDKPEGFSGGWWSKPLSLLPPHVPMYPDSSWWIQSALNSAKQSNTNIDSLSVLITGRIHRDGMQRRIHDLLHQAGLRFDHVYLNPGKEDTVRFKVRTLEEILTRNPSIEEVHVWEDNTQNLGAMGRFVEQCGLVFEPHLISNRMNKSAMNHSETKLYGIRITQFFQEHLGRFTTKDAQNLHSGLLILMQGVHSNSKVPRDLHKHLSSAAKFFTKKVPKDPYGYSQWELEAQAHLSMVMESLLLPEKKQGMQIGPFILVDGAGATTKEIEVASSVLEHAISLIRSHPLHNMERILYGEVHMVGRLQKPSIQAWYFQRADNISIVKRKDLNKDFLWSFLHEIAHRYYMRFADKNSIEDWKVYHNHLERTAPHPKIGDKLYGVKGEPTLVGYKDGFALLDTGKHLTPRDIEKISLWNQYPTAYASTNDSEHFSEAYAAYCFNELKPEAKMVFEGIWK